MESVILSLEPRQTHDDRLTLAANLKHPDGRNLRLWWTLAARWAFALTDWADPFVVGMLFPIMQWGKDVVVEGRVSPSLLTNLETFMANWHAWVPEKYQPVQIRAREEAEPPFPADGSPAVSAFSCGVDSCFTALRHRQGLAGRRTQNLAAGVLIHGFDIRLDQEHSQAMFNGVLRQAGILLESIGMECIAMTGNFHELPTLWGHSLGTHLVSALSLLGGRFSRGLIPNDTPIIRLQQVAGSHPLNNPLLGSRCFSVRDDGGESLRYEKLRFLSDWPEAMRHLRVCFQNPRSHENCCLCTKCLCTILSFRAVGLKQPPAFGLVPPNHRIAMAKFQHEDDFWTWEDVLRGAAENGLDDTRWAGMIRLALGRNRIRRTWRTFTRKFIPLRNAIRTVFRGSPLNRRELAKASPTQRTN